ncbi:MULTISPECIES: isocitrate lyase/phosphoenolpyruvate mutase family protein [unclassified Streptomyces]|uniref:isocitrate lyase/PEP mutase family protein n=1 Tax=unclassified Streptomyces TaxID=2593676 RepID=UPI002DD90925|nr:MULTISPECIES: isocitrate lyase/phosphoenolpyruvate mutase family protein [unclassified Streptomyces]WSA93802.1 isocitrate lyase/phosphoenolpyruvate mutase family protein [Streptomyces sp. NBC_01795]WSB78172.1 isocitrate lyase/phosphoenolpyruvate mutase family protein [Streptomyces sp. NBC_01775]WSS13576.1 isocitrate lyase/phosphoenolpyruvate mutase family protein [Streptomyces sp. NBC_01186]WSS42371.1 isocitrate lyase/phosphoenolpyruvate mutase family protein [Streptomyces sp. NBC_01187]
MSGLTPFAALHDVPHAPLLLPNAWDYSSAAVLAANGFAAIGTTSLGVAGAAGVPDGAGVTKEATLAQVRCLGRGPFLLSVDAEGGFSDDPDEVAALAREFAEAGAVGLNLEDGRPDGTLVPVAVHAAKVRAVKAAVPDLFVNARTDTHWLGTGQDETLSRLLAYQQAGADGAFVPGLTEPARIGALVEALDVPLNILYSPTGPTLPELGSLGVRRVSLGSLLYRQALSSALRTARTIRSGQHVPAAELAYGDVQQLAPTV